MRNRVRQKIRMDKVAELTALPAASPRAGASSRSRCVPFVTPRGIKRSQTSRLLRR
jgi:hypothetical protein